MMANNKNSNRNQVGKNIVITSAGMCSSLGYNLDAAVCALAANIDHFSESSFYSHTGKPIIAASLPDLIYGQERLGRWIEYALLDCVKDINDLSSLFDPDSLAVIILTQDSSRPNPANILSIETITNILNKIYLSLHPDIGVVDRSTWKKIHLISEGRTSLAPALKLAEDYLINDHANKVLIIAADNYINTSDINFYHNENRLLVKGNSDGFLPGEAAVALLIELRGEVETGLHINGVAQESECGRHDGSTPSRGIALTKAIREACGRGKIDPLELRFRISTQTSEQFFSNDASNAFSRVMFGGKKLTQLTIDDKLGEIGAASGPAMLAWLYREMANSKRSPGDLGLAHLSSENGMRCAIALQYKKGKQ